MDLTSKLIKMMRVYTKPLRNLWPSLPLMGLSFLLLIPSFVSCQSPDAKVENPAFQVVIDQYVGHTVPEVSVSEIEKPQNYLFLDTRSQAEWKVSHIPGAMWVGFEDFTLDRVAEVPKDQPLMVYCAIGYRSEKISEKLQRAGYQHVYNVIGGIFEWVNVGNAVENDQGPVKQVHGYSQPFGMFIDGAEVVY